MIPWAHPSPQPKRHLDRLAILAQMTAVSLHLTMERPFPLKLAHSHGGSGPHLIHGSLVHLSPQPKRHFDGFSRFAGLTSVTDRPHATQSVTIGRIYVLRCGLTTINS